MGSLICRVELNKEKGKGITITVENADDKITQTIVMDGTAITTTCKGNEETSVITQKQDSISIKCKDFKLDAETITCTSTKDTVHESKQKFDIKSTQDMTLESKAKFTAKATNDVSIAGMNVKVDGKTNIELKGTNVKQTATAAAETKGATLKLEGSGMAEIKAGGVLKIEASGALSAKGAATVVQGNITTIKGTAGNIVVS